MATSSAYSFDVQRDELVALALADVGAIAPGETPTATMKTHAVQVLNMLVKSMDADGQYLWRITRRSATITAATASYSLAADVLDIDEPANFMVSGETTRVTVRPMTRDQYMELADRTTTGSPVFYFLEKTLTAVTLYLYPVPVDSGTLEYAASLKARDMDSGTVTSDFPVKWARALRYGLAMDLCAPYRKVDKIGAFKALFDQEKLKLLNDDTERGDIQIVPFGHCYGGSY